MLNEAETHNEYPNLTVQATRIPYFLRTTADQIEKRFKTGISSKTAYTRGRVIQQVNNAAV